MRFRAKLLDISCITHLSSKCTIYELSVVELVSMDEITEELFGRGIELAMDVFCTYTAGVVSTLARNVKTCVLRLCPDRACFVIVERGPTGGSNIWCELTQVEPTSIFLTFLTSPYIRCTE